MVSNEIAVVVFLANDVGKVFHQVSNIEKSGLHPIVLKNGEDLGGVVRIRAIVKGQRDLRQVSIAVKEWIT